MSKGKKTTLIITIALLIVATLLSCYLAMSNVNITARAETEETYHNWTWSCSRVPLTFLNIYQVAGANKMFARQLASSDIWIATWYYEIVDNEANVYSSGTYTFSSSNTQLFQISTNYGYNSDFHKATALTEQTWAYKNTEGTVINQAFYNFTNNTTTGTQNIVFKLSTPSSLNLQDLKIKVCHVDEMQDGMKEISTNNDYPFFETNFSGIEGLTGTELSVLITNVEAGTSATPKYPIKYNQEVVRTESYNQGYTEGQQSLTETEQYQNGYNQGMTNGYKQGNETGYNQGYQDCETEKKEEWFQGGYNVGYQGGLDEGYSTGYEEGYEKGSYDVNISVTELAGNTIGSIGDFIMSILTIEVAGISLWSILAVLGGLIIIGIIIKLAT